MNADPAKLLAILEHVAEIKPQLEKAAADTKRLETDLAQYKTKQAEAAALAPAIVDLLIKQGHLDATSRDNAIASLGNPVNALKTIQNLVNMKSAAVTKKAEDAGSLGSPSSGDTKSAVAANAGRPSDQAFLRRLGLA